MRKQNNCICLTCNKKFYIRPSHVKRGEGRFCSKKCMYGNLLYKQAIAGTKMGDKNCARKLKVREKISRTLTGKFLSELHPNWLGEKVGYSGIHKWVAYHLGKPKICEHCGKTILNPYQIHWANKSQKYLRDLTDWLRLCVPCHRKYDASVS